MASKAVLDVFANVSRLTIEQSAKNALANSVRGAVDEAFRKLDISNVFKSAEKALDQYANKLKYIQALTSAPLFNKEAAAKASTELLIAKQRFEYEQKIAALKSRIEDRLVAQRNRAEAAEKRRQDAEAARRQREFDRQQRQIEKQKQSAYSDARRQAISRVRGEITDTESIIASGEISPNDRRNAERRLQQRQQQLETLERAKKLGQGLTTQQISLMANNTITSNLAKTVSLREQDAKALLKQAQAIDNTRFSAARFGEQIGLATKRFAAFIIGSAPILLIGNAFRVATQEALKFEKSQTRLAQILNKQRSDTKGIVNSAVSASQRTGTSATDVLQGIDILAQAGFQNVNELRGSIELLSKVPLQATFGNIEQTTEGLLSLLSQFPEFNGSLDNTRTIFDKLNRVAADYAVEVKDIFEGLKRGGSVFEQTGGKFDDFLELFTLLRSRSRESAETIGVFFKSIGFRIFRQENEDLLRELNVTATTLPEVLKQISGSFEKLFPSGTEGDPRAIRIAEKLAGLNQGGRFITLLNAISADKGKFANTISGAAGSFDADAAKRLGDIGTSLTRIQAAFNTFTSALTQNESLRVTVKLFADLANSIADVSKYATSALVPISILGAAIAAPTAISTIGGIGRKIGLFGGTDRSQFATNILPVNDVISYRGRSIDTNVIRRDRFLQPLFGSYGSRGFEGVTETERGILERRMARRGVSFADMTDRQRNRAISRTILDLRDDAPITSAIGQIFPQSDVLSNRLVRKFSRFERTRFMRALRRPGVAFGASALALGGAALASNIDSPGGRAATTGLAVGGTIAGLAPFTGPAAPFVLFGAVVAGLTARFVSLSKESSNLELSLKNAALDNQISSAKSVFQLSELTNAKVRNSLENSANLFGGTSLDDVRNAISENVLPTINSDRSRGIINAYIKEQLTSGKNRSEIQQDLFRKFGVDNSIDEWIRRFVNKYRFDGQYNQDAISSLQRTTDDARKTLTSIINSALPSSTRVSPEFGIASATRRFLNTNLSAALKDNINKTNIALNEDILPISNRSLNQSSFEFSNFALPNFTNQSFLKFLRNNASTEFAANTPELKFLELQQGALGGSFNTIAEALQSGKRSDLLSALQLTSQKSDFRLNIPDDFSSALDDIAIKFNISVEEITKTLLTEGASGLRDKLEQQMSQSINVIKQNFEIIREPLVRSQQIINQFSESVIQSKNALADLRQRIIDNNLEGTLRRNEILGRGFNNQPVISGEVSRILNETSVQSPISLINRISKIPTNIDAFNPAREVERNGLLRSLRVVDNNNERALNSFGRALDLATKSTDIFANKLANFNNSLVSAGQLDLSNINQSDVRFFGQEIRSLFSESGRANIGLGDFLGAGSLLERRYSPKDLQRLSQTSGLFGDIPLSVLFGGNDTTSANKISEEFIKSAGISQTAKIVSQVTGESEINVAERLRKYQETLIKQQESALQKEEEIRTKFNEAVVALSTSTEAKLKADEERLSQEKDVTDRLLKSMEYANASASLLNKASNIYSKATKLFNDAVENFRKTTRNPSTNTTDVNVSAQVNITTDVAMLKLREAKFKDAIEKAIHEAFQGQVNVNIQTPQE